MLPHLLTLPPHPSPPFLPPSPPHPLSISRWAGFGDLWDALQNPTEELTTAGSDVTGVVWNGVESQSAVSEEEETKVEGKEGSSDAADGDDDDDGDDEEDESDEDAEEHLQEEDRGNSSSREGHVPHEQRRVVRLQDNSPVFIYDYLYRSLETLFNSPRFVGIYL